MTSIGETLRSERLRLGLDLDQVAERTKIGTRLLQAMEANDFDKLPGGVFTRSFVKQYARVLGLDEEAIGAEFKTIENRNEDTPAPVKGFRSETEIPSNVSNDRSSRISNLDPKSRSMLVSAGWAALAIGVCAGGYYFLNHERVVAPVAPKESAAIQAPVQAPVETAPKPPPTPVVKPEPAPAPVGVVQVLLKASEDSWISVTADGKTRFEGILQANDSKQIDANEKVKVIAGNSGGLEIALNGKSIGPIGRSGQRRTVELTPEGAHVVRRISPPTDPVL
ncbi:MAG: DUF4115 domain-containing protein [Acidobacteriota bacterium]|nr:DUF4115 domain-containing protein [Acidobacteriota bacterium]